MQHIIQNIQFKELYDVVLNILLHQRPKFVTAEMYSLEINVPSTSTSEILHAINIILWLDCLTFDILQILQRQQQIMAYFKWCQVGKAS